MKKTVLVLGFMLMCGFLFAQNGTVIGINGTVELKQPGAAHFVAAKVGDKIGQNTVISTGFKSTALIEVGSSRITVRPLTRLALTEIQASQGNETLNVNVQAGRMRVEVKPPAGVKNSTTVQSPTATASVRGTEFDFDTRNLFVREGAVSFNGNHGVKVRINAGSGSRVKENGLAVDPVEIKTSTLLPSFPAGSSSNSGNSETQTFANENVTMDITY